jgi:hypothetical protein
MGLNSVSPKSNHFFGILFQLIYMKYFIFLLYEQHTWGTLLVAQLVEALRYKPEGRGFDSRFCHWKFSLT